MTKKLAVICASYFRKLLQAATIRATVGTPADTLLSVSVALLHVLSEGTKRLSKHQAFTFTSVVFLIAK